MDKDLQAIDHAPDLIKRARHNELGCHESSSRDLRFRVIWFFLGNLFLCLDRPLLLLNQHFEDAWKVWLEVLEISGYGDLFFEVIWNGGCVLEGKLNAYAFWRSICNLPGDIFLSPLEVSFLLCACVNVQVTLIDWTNTDLDQVCKISSILIIELLFLFCPDLRLLFFNCENLWLIFKASTTAWEP